MPDLSGFSVTIVCVTDDCVLLVVLSKFVPFVFVVVDDALH